MGINVRASGRIGGDVFQTDRVDVFHCPETLFNLSKAQLIVKIVKREVSNLEVKYFIFGNARVSALSIRTAFKSICCLPLPFLPKLSSRMYNL